jgi:hypothetical protein
MSKWGGENMICYRFYMTINQVKPATEEKMKVQCLASEYFEAFTIYNAVHFAIDSHKRGFVLEVISNEYDQAIQDFAFKLKGLLGRDKILITAHEIKTQLI